MMLEMNRMTMMRMTIFNQKEGAANNNREQHDRQQKIDGAWGDTNAECFQFV